MFWNDVLFENINRKKDMEGGVFHGDQTVKRREATDIKVSRLSNARQILGLVHFEK